MPSEYPYSYPQIAQESTLRLDSEIKDLIRKKKPLQFTKFMELALYHQDLGYYTKGDMNVGKKGDFITSVSVGACFGSILASRITKEWLDQGSPQEFHLLELGANNGQLAIDLLNAIEQNSPELYICCQYHIIEHLDTVQANQKKTLSHHNEKTHFHTTFSNLGKHGVILSNELFDAFPVHLLKFKGGQWHEKQVHIDEDGQLAFTIMPLDNHLSDHIPSISQHLPAPSEGYETEFRPNLKKYIRNFQIALEHALVITIDYGHTASNYYAPSRSTGTLRCYHQHQADDNPLILPGLKDITAHVEFTNLAQALRDNGYHITDFCSQSHYLTKYGAECLIQMEQEETIDYQFIRQFQTLTHPSTMGHQFQVLEAHTHRNEHTSSLTKLELEV